MNYLTGMYVKISNQFNGWKKDERGSQTLEWLGIAAVIVIIVGLVSSSFDGVGEKVSGVFDGFIDKISGD